MSELPVPELTVTAENERMFTAAAAGRLELPRCDACRALIWYPRGFCPRCGSGAVTWEALSGHGTIYSFTVVRRAGAPAFAGAAPYCLAYVDLAEGARMLTNIVTADLDALAVGQPVRAVFDRVNDDCAVVRFRPAAES